MECVSGILICETIKEEKEYKVGGLVVPSKDDKFKDYSFGRVIASGEYKYQYGKRLDMDIKEGNIICFTKHHPLVGEIRIRDKVYYSMPEERVHCYWNNEEEYKKEMEQKNEN